MSIELKQAAQQAVDAFEAFGEADDFATLFTLTQKMNALRTAIQQAESDHARLPGVLKDHQIAAMVNSLRDIARQFHGHGSLRERIANVLVPALKAEAKTGEPVDFPAGAIINGRTLMERLEACPFESQGGDLRMCSDWHELRRCFEHLSNYAYTHPAPGVPDDSKRLDYLQDRGATIDLIPGFAGFYPMRFRVGGLRSSANIDVRAAIDAAMLTAAQAQKGQG